MVNPKLSLKSDNALTVSKNTKKLFQVIYQEQNKDEKDDDIPKIKVSTFISKMAFYYEKIRNSVDYKEEYLLRKNAILRILKRQIVIQGAIHARSGEKVSKDLLTELIRAGYLPNNKIPETKIGEIGKIIDKYIKLKKYGLVNKDLGERGDIVNWILSMAACDIEETLGMSKTDHTVISNVYDTLGSTINLVENSPYEKDKDIQIYIGIHRGLLKFDNDLVGFILFKYFIADWKNADEKKIAEIGKNLDSLKVAIDNQIAHPLAKQLSRIINRYTVFFVVLSDVIEEDPSSVYEYFRDDPKAFPRDIKKVCKKRYALARTKLWRAAIRSIIYIFITKSVFVLLLEIPATKWFGEEINIFTLVINISFPALLLFLVVLFTRLPGDDNTDKIIEGIEELVFEEKKRTEPYQLRKVVKRGRALNTIFGIFYSATFFASFGVVIWGLNRIEFSWVSIVIFLFFLAFVSFFAIRIRKHAHEITVIEPKENIFGFFIDFFYVPVIAAGKWLSENFSRINVFVFILDFIIEAPFKIFVEIAEEWTRYVKERKEEIM